MGYRGAGVRRDWESWERVGREKGESGEELERVWGGSEERVRRELGESGEKVGRKWGESEG